MNTLTSAPNTIYLNISDDKNDFDEECPTNSGDVTWSVDPAVSVTVKYVKATGTRKKAKAKGELPQEQPVPHVEAKPASTCSYADEVNQWSEWAKAKGETV